MEDILKIFLIFSVVIVVSDCILVFINCITGNTLEAYKRMFSVCINLIAIKYLYNID